jgi:hypothetical protein
MLSQLSCSSGRSKACPNYADALRWGYGDENFRNSDGSTDIEERDEMRLMAYKLGCAYGGAQSCAWLDQNGQDRWPGCDPLPGPDAENAEFCVMISEMNLVPIPSD